MKYDDASWHSGGDFPEDLPSEAGATHIDEAFSDEGIDFAEHYDESGTFLEDYENLVGDGLESLYHASDNWETYDALESTFAARHNDWKRNA